jgi:hypothetical protein
MKNRPHLIPCLIAAILLFIAVMSLPYGYYQILRWLVFVCSMYVVYLCFKWKLSWLSWLFIIIAIVFNPLFPIIFSEGTWKYIDVATGVIFILSTIFLREHINGKPDMVTPRFLRNIFTMARNIHIKPIKPLYLIILIAGLILVISGVFYYEKGTGAFYGTFLDSPTVSEEDIIYFVKVQSGREDITVSLNYVGDGIWQGQYSFPVNSGIHKIVDWSYSEETRVLYTYTKSDNTSIVPDTNTPTRTTTPKTSSKGWVKYKTVK